MSAVPPEAGRAVGPEGAILLGAVLVAALAACRVPSPTPEQVRRYGFDDPRQGYEALVTALQGNLAEDEYRCLSTGLRDELGLSRHEYLAFRDRFLAEHPLARWALARSRVEEVVHLDGRTARLRVRVPVPFREDPTFVLGFEREDFSEARVDGRHVEDPRRASGTPEEYDLVRDRRVALDEGDDRWLWSGVPLARPLSPAALARGVSIRHGTEWRLDDFPFE